MAKNELSRLLRHVKRGETVLITERNHPIARLEPFSASSADAPSASLAALYEAGLLSPPKASGFDPRAWIATLPSNAPLSSKQSLAAAILADREESP